MEFESSVMGEISAQRSPGGRGHTWEDVMYTVMGDASPASIFVLVFAVAFFAAVPAAMLLIFGTYSGGMRWLITLGMVAVMGFIAIYLMRKGTVAGKRSAEPPGPQTEFRGQLTGLTETVDRAASGYVYSQQMLRERLCDALLDKLAAVRDLDPEEMATMLESGDASFVGDEVLEIFMLRNRRGAKGRDESRVQTRGRSAERGSKFIIEIEGILRKMEAIV